MNHQPFETWLLEEKSLTPQERRALQSHLRECKYCSALVETAAALRSRKMAPPAPGFATRFERRLDAQRFAYRRRKFWGAIVFVAGSLALLALLGGSTILSIVNSPAEWITIWVGYLLFLVTSLQALTEVGIVLLKIVPEFVPPFVWLVIASLVAALSLLWTIAIWRFTRLPRGV